MTNAHVRTGARAGTDRLGDVAQWLQLVRECNRIRPGMFGRPELGEWWAGGTVEEYPDARVIHRGDGTVSVCSKTEAGEATIREAAGRLGLNVAELVTEVQLTRHAVRVVYRGRVQDIGHGEWHTVCSCGFEAVSSSRRVAQSIADAGHRVPPHLTNEVKP